MRQWVEIMLKWIQIGLETGFTRESQQSARKRRVFISGFPSTGYGETFSGREKEILSLIAEGFSNHTIAQKLYLSLATVKWYNKQIYGKLGVSSRTQAIARAREVGLFASGVAFIALQESRPKHNLPTALTSYIGREKELGDLHRLLQSESIRLVTITGAGGVGKTRLALRIAEEVLPTFTQGAWLVDLSALDDPALLAQYVANALGWRGKAGIPYEDLLIRVLRPRDLLLLLDSCEHLVDACAHLAASLLTACPNL
jgi:ATP/maltotriose-dependent transcriptional regulator MalT